MKTEKQNQRASGPGHVCRHAGLPLPFYIMIIMGTHYNEDLFKQIRLLPGRYLLKISNRHERALFALLLEQLLHRHRGHGAGGAGERHGGLRLLQIPVQGPQVPVQLHSGHHDDPPGLVLVAFAMEMKAFGWNNTHLPFIIPWAANGFGVFLMAQSMKAGVPTEILESARIDGCGEPRLFFTFVLQLSKPFLLTLGLLVFLQSWNNFLTPLVMINKPEMLTIPLGMYTLGAVYRTDYAARVLGLSLGTLPLILLFLFNSKSFIRGLAAGAVKG